MASTSRLASALAAVAVVLTAAQAGAVTPKFRKEFVAAKALYDAGKYEEALAGFERARAIEEAPEALYSLARCHERLGNRAEAVELYATFLGRAPEHRGAPKARGFLTSLLLEGARAALTDGEAPDWGLSFARASRGLEFHAATDPSLSDATAAQLFVLQAEALVALGRRDEAVTSYGRALGAEVTPSVREEIEERMAELVAPPESAPASAPAESAPASAPASAPVLPESAPVRTTLPVVTLPPVRKKMSPAALAIIAGSSAGAVAIAVAVSLLVILVRPTTDLGYFQVDFRP